MLENGIDIETISELTGLTAEEVSRLKERSDSIRRNDATAPSVTH